MGVSVLSPETQTGYVGGQKVGIGYVGGQQVYLDPATGKQAVDASGKALTAPKTITQSNGQSVSVLPTGNTEVKPSPAIYTSGAARSDLTDVKGGLAKIDAGIQNQNQARDAYNTQKATEDAQNKTNQQNNDLLNLLKGDNNGQNDPQLLTRLANGDTTKSYFESNGNVYEQNSGSMVGTVDDLRSGKLAQNLGVGGTNSGNSGNYNPATGLTEGEKQVGTTLNSIQAQSDKNINDFATLISSIRNGTFALSPDEQAQLQQTQDMFNREIQAQVKANESYEAGVGAQLIRTGVSRYAGDYAMNRMKQAVDQGIAKITDIEAKAAKAVSDLRTALVKQDYTMINDLYTKLQDQLKEKTNAIQKINDDVRQAAQDAYKQRQDAIVNSQKDREEAFKEKMDNANLTLNQKKEAFDEYYKKADLTEKQKQDAFDRWYKTQDLALKKAANDIQAGIGSTALPTVKMTGNNTPNRADQASFLNTLPGGANGSLATLVKKIANYDINPSAIPTRQFKGAGGFTQQQILTLVSQFDPTYSQSQYASRQALQTNFTSGKFAQNINALNTAIGHISDIYSNFSQLNNTWAPGYNSLKNSINVALGKGGVGKASLNINAATAELATVFKGTGATDEEIRNLGTLKPNSSPDQVKQFIEGATQLLASRLNALEDTYQTGMGKAKDGGFLSSTSQENLLNLRSNGLDIKVPELADSPIVKIQAFHDTSPENAQVLEQIYKAIPNASPQDVEDYLAQKGINL